MDSKLIFQNLIHSRDYATRVLPYIKEEFFADNVERKLYQLYTNYIETYKDIPSVEVLMFELKKSKGLGQTDFDRAVDYVNQLNAPTKTPDHQYLLDETEAFCLQRSCYNAISKCIGILDDSSSTPLTAIPDILKDALSISFNNEVGHDYIESVEDRYNKLHEQTARIKTGITWIDRVYGGGIPRKTLSCWMAQSGGGKSLMLVHQGAQFFKDGHNVLYITLELSEERIGERADANLMGIDVLDIPKLDIDTYKNKVAKIADKTKGRLFIKEYPPGTITASHIRALLDELKLKKGFIPDVLIVDYINLMNSSRYKASSGANSYTIIKAIAEELRAIAVEFNIICLTATQMNRGGTQDSDPDMSGVSESFGLPATVDALFAIVRNENLDSLGNILLKNLKTRFSDLTNHKSMVGIEWNKMTVKDLGDDGIKGIAQDIPTSAPTPELKPAFMSKEKPKKKFADITV